MFAQRTRTNLGGRRLRGLVLGVATLGFATAGLAGAAAPAGAAASLTLKLVNHSGLGKILVNGTGMTVYIFTSDSPNKASCTGGCLSVWPAVTVPKGVRPEGGPGVRGLGTITTAGKVQVTWNKHPLYTYALDSGPGVVNGNGVKEGSGVWYAATSKLVGGSGTKTSKSPSGGSTGGYGY